MMQNLITILLIFGFQLNLFASIIESKTKIKTVTVFRNGAQIKRVSNVALLRGINDVMLLGIPSGFDMNTLSVSVSNSVKVVSVSTSNTLYDKGTKDQKILELEKTLNEKIITFDENNNILSTYKEEESLLLSNKNLNGTQNGVNPENLLKMADLYRTRLLSIKQKISEYEKNTKKIGAEIRNLEKEIEEYNASINKNTVDVLLQLMAENDSNSEITLSYVDPRARWSSTYDIRLSHIDQPLLLINNAQISQSTGENWEEVKMFLTTGDPSRSFGIPKITPWFLQYLNLIVPLGSEVKVKGSRSNETVYFVDGVRLQSNVRSDDVDGGIVTENFTFTEYNIPYNISIPTNNKYREVQLKTDTLMAILKYYYVPSMNNKVFLKANIPDWNQFSLSSGYLKIYFENTFVGTSYLDANSSNDTLELSLGQDIAINAEMKKLKSYHKKSLFSSKKEFTEGFEYTIRNNKSYPINVEIQERIPIATDKDMEVDLIESSGATLNKETGILTWNLDLGAAKQVSYKWAYSVKIPNNKNIQLLQGYH